MTIGAAWPIGFDAQAEVVDQVTLADALRQRMVRAIAGNGRRIAEPREMPGVHDLLGRIRVALEAGARDARAILQGLLIKTVMVRVAAGNPQVKLRLVLGSVVRARPIQLPGKNNARGQCEHYD